MWWSQCQSSIYSVQETVVVFGNAQLCWLKSGVADANACVSRMFHFTTVRPTVVKHGSRAAHFYIAVHLLIWQMQTLQPVLYWEAKPHFFPPFECAFFPQWVESVCRAYKPWSVKTEWNNRNERGFLIPSLEEKRHRQSNNLTFFENKPTNYLRREGKNRCNMEVTTIWALKRCGWGDFKPWTQSSYVDQNTRTEYQ